MCVSSRAGDRVLHVQLTLAREASAAGQLHVASLVSRRLARHCTEANDSIRVSEMYVNTVALRSLCCVADILASASLVASNKSALSVSENSRYS